MALANTNPSRAAPSRLAVNGALLALCLIWGSTWLVIREGLEDLPPFLSAGTRFTVAAMIFVALVPLLRRREGGEPPPTWLWVIHGVLNLSVSYGVVYYCEQTLPSGLVSLLWAVFPMMMAVSGHWFLPGERLAPGRWLGFGLGFAGIAVLFRTDLDSFGGDAVITGAILLLSPLVSCVGNTVIKRHASESSSVLLNRNGMILAAVLLLTLSFGLEGDAQVAWTGRALLSIAYLAVVGTVVTFGLYFWLLRYARAHRLSLIAYVTPATALLLGWAVGGESITRFTLMGAGLILVGVVLVVLPGRDRARSQADPEPTSS